LDYKVGDIVPVNPSAPYDMHDVIERLVDNGDFFEVKKEFAPEMIIGFGRLDNRTKGIIANQPKIRAGALTVDSSDKQARFIRFCDCFNIPLLLLVDTPAYMPGMRQEHAGIIRHGAKVLYALCEAVVPRVAVILRKSYGGGSLGMGVVPGLGTDYIFSWPTAERGVLGAEQAVALYHKEQEGKSEDHEAYLAKKVQEYRETMANPLYEASSNLEFELIEPQETRRYLIHAFRSLRGKRTFRQRKHHGNIPL
jgi:acetyl-CoA carboxylase carboxyltransferase component